MKKNIFYAQSGGVTPVINATAFGLINAVKKYKNFFGKIYAGKNGIIGALREELIDISKENQTELNKLQFTPGGAFGSCRLKLKDPIKNKKEFERIVEVFKSHNIGYFFYNGGGDSQDTTLKLSQYCKSVNYHLQCIGLPKTIDNDLPVTDSCPGFGTAAKYIAVSTYEASLDVSSMAESSTKVFILEVMGRHAGWLAAASGIIKNKTTEPPHIILFPEVTFNSKKFLRKVSQVVKTNGYCVIVSSEGIRNSKKEFISSGNGKDSFGHAQLGGVAPKLASMVANSLKYKVHWAVSDYLQRASRHIGSKIDVKQAIELGKKSVEFAKQGKNEIMLTIKGKRRNGKYSWSIGHTNLRNVANKEKSLPKRFISSDRFNITKKCKEYILDLVKGEDYPTYKNGIPEYTKLKKYLVKKKLKKFFI
ncbi:MAG: 6-phosphofructokinase [Pseudomonadota bacterium]|nr:6-phosphofructokinase [Pseudomonadota bacterium]